MMRTRNNNVAIEGKDIRAILFRNFTGAPDTYNPKGCIGNFTVVLEDEKAKELEQIGLNVKRKPNRDGDEEARLKVFVRFDHVPPKVYRVNSRTTAELDEDTIGLLDNDDIVDADLIINPYAFEINGLSGKKAYLSKGYFTVAEDQFADKYLGREKDEVPFD